MPRAEIVDPEKVAKTDAIPYRPLTPADFHAKAPPIADESHAEQMGAYTCARVASRGKTHVQMTRDPASGRFTARPAVVAVAQMDRSCSWWNPKLSGESRPYILQHEQIHFAIAELTARDFTARASRLSATGDSVEEAAAALQRAIESAFRDAMDEMNARNLDFDRDTAGRHDTALQQRWFDQVSAELKR